MGTPVDRESFSADELAAFGARLRESLDALRELLLRPGFGDGPATIGAELECNLVDDRGRAAPVSDAVLGTHGQDGLTAELTRWVLEYNARPLPLAGASLRGLRAELETGLGAVRAAAARARARVVTIGTLPTLREEDLGAGAITGRPRYRALSSAFRRRRGRAFEVRFDGAEPLLFRCETAAVIGATTSLQIHLRVAPEAFARTYNAAQLAIIPALAASGNSPLFLGRRLWDESRIPLFAQGADDRADASQLGADPRVTFGHGWVRQGAAELFAESVALHDPVLAVLGDEDPLARVRSGAIPALSELRLHHGTTYPWNRAVYDPGSGGHLRIELRALAAGPSLDDMVANAAFLLGATLGLAERIDALLPGYPFAYAAGSFLRAAEHGLAAELVWPRPGGHRASRVRASELALELVPLARRALIDAGVDRADVDAALDVLERRVRRGTTGARWQCAELAAIERHRPREVALTRMLERYMELSAGGRPVHDWPAR